MSPAEVIARAAGHACCGDCPRADYDRVARLALAALDAAGLAVVPKEPTDEMQIAGTEEWLTVRAMEDRAAVIYRAMVAAAKEGE
jgi:hypothetical protein